MQFSQPFRTAAQSSQSGAVRETRDCVLHSVTATDSQSGSRFAPFMSGLYAPAASVPALRLRTYAESAEPSGLVILDGSCPSSPLRHSSHLHLRRPDPPYQRCWHRTQTRPSCKSRKDRTTSPEHIPARLLPRRTGLPAHSPEIFKTTAAAVPSKTSSESSGEVNAMFNVSAKLDRPASIQRW